MLERARIEIALENGTTLTFRVENMEDEESLPFHRFTVTANETVLVQTDDADEMKEIARAFTRLAEISGDW